MCDQQLLEKWKKDRAQSKVSRREFGAVAGLTSLAACAPAGQASDSDAAAASLALTESAVKFETEDGTMDAFWVHPSEGKHPAIIFWPDIASIREAKRNMARRLAGEGYAVLVLNPYYRDVAGEQYGEFMDLVEAGGFGLVGPYREKHTADAIMGDARAAVAWLDAQDAVDTSKGIGSEGYCMGGPLAVWTAAAVPARVKAAASFHGGGLVREGDAKSPHATFAATEASYLIAIGQDDDANAPDEKAVLSDTAKAAGREAQIKVYAGNHGWTVPDTPVYAEAPAEEAFADKVALYTAAL